MSKQQHADLYIHAELAWRIGHCYRFWGSYYADAYINLELEKKLVALTQLFSESTLVCHPVVCNNKEVLGLIEDIFNESGPSLRYQLHKYCNFNNGHVGLARIAALHHPNSDMHRYEYVSKRKRSLQYFIHKGSIINEIPFSRPMVFTPIMEMAVGHYAVINEYLVLQRLLGYKAPVYLLGSGHGVDCGILDALLAEFDNLIYKEADNVVDIIRIAGEYRSHLLDCDYRFYWLGETTQDKLRLLSSSLPTKRNSLNVVLHTRTSVYKNDSNNEGNNLRSVNPRTYCSLVSTLKKIGFTVCQISAGASDVFTTGCNALIVNDSNSKAYQWESLSSVHFIVGTSSGISHFACRASFRSLLTNYTSMPSDYFLTDTMVVSLKRFRFKAGTLKCTPETAASLIIRHWSDRLEDLGCLCDYAKISDLSDYDLEANIIEYLEYISGRAEISRFRKLLSGRVDESFLKWLPNWPITSTSAEDILLFLEESSS